jgi:hypothetical protein
MSDEHPRDNHEPDPARQPVQADGAAQADAEAPGSEQPAVEETVEPTLVEVRRTPNYWSFMLLFGVLAAIAITIITFALPYDASTATYSRGAVYGFALLFSVAFGVALGAIVALIAERVSRRSIRLVEAQRITGRMTDSEHDARRR